MVLTDASQFALLFLQVTLIVQWTMSMLKFVVMELWWMHGGVEIKKTYLTVSIGHTHLII